MQVIEQQCPHCNARLRLRGPAQAGQNLPCPDCSNQLIVEAHSDGPRLVAIESHSVSLASKVSARQAGKSPTIIAWCVAAVAMLPVGWGLLGSDNAQPKPTAGEPVEPASGAPNQPQPTTQPPVSGPEINESHDRSEVLPHPEPDDETTTIDAAPPPDEAPSVGAAHTETPVAEVDNVAPSVRPVKQTEAMQRQAAQAALDATALSDIRQRLAIRLSAYEMAQPVSLAAFLNEVSGLGATWINTNGLGESLKKPIQVRLRDATLEQVLAAGLRQAGFKYQILPTGVHLSRHP